MKEGSEQFNVGATTILPADIVYSDPSDAPPKVNIVKRNTQQVQLISNKLVKRAQHKVHDQKIAMAQAERELQEQVLRAKNIGMLNRWDQFKVNRDLAIRAYVNVSNARKKKNAAITRVIAR